MGNNQKSWDGRNGEWREENWPAEILKVKTWLSPLIIHSSFFITQTSTLTPLTLNPQPSTLNPQTLNLKPRPPRLNPQPLNPPLFALNSQPSILNPKHSTFNPLVSNYPSTLHLQPLAVNSQLSTLRPHSFHLSRISHPSNLRYGWVVEKGMGSDFTHQIWKGDTLVLKIGDDGELFGGRRKS